MLSQKNVLRCFLLSVHIFLTGAVLFLDQVETKVDFLYFALSFGILIYVSLFKIKSPVFSFFSVFIYLGFFIKICMHALFAYPFVEPIGAFSGSKEEWMIFFRVSSLGAIAATCAAYIFYFTNKKYKFPTEHKALLISEDACKKYCKAVFCLLTVFIFFIAFINLKLGINLSGIAAITILPWPLNALIGFSHYMGFSVVIAVYGLHEYTFNKKITYTLALVLIEAFVSSVSILSRGLFLFHFIPFFICILIFRDELLLKFRNLFLILLTAAVLFVASGFLVTSSRSILYSDYNLNSQTYASKNLFEYKKSSFSGGLISFAGGLNSFASEISQLVVDRWIGSEGLMAVVSYPDKKMMLIYESLLRKPKVGEKDIFEYMNKSFYPISLKYVFTSLPGPVAFFYYSGSYIVVFLCMVIFVGLLFLLQEMTEQILKNIFLQYQTAFFFAISFMQFGISPRPLVISFFMLFCSVIVMKIFLQLTHFFRNKKNI